MGDGRVARMVGKRLAGLVWLINELVRNEESGRGKTTSGPGACAFATRRQAGLGAIPRVPVLSGIDACRRTLCKAHQVPRHCCCCYNNNNGNNHRQKDNMSWKHTNKTLQILKSAEEGGYGVLAAIV